MRKRNRQKQKIGKRYRWPLLAALAVVVIAIGAMTVISRQSSANTKVRSTARAASDKKYVTIKVAGRDVQVDPQTGQVRPLSPQEAQQLADGLKKLINKSTDGLAQEQHADGSVSMDLQGRFQNVAVARTEADGTITQSCVDEPAQAAAFFGIDPALLGVQPKTSPAQQAQAAATTGTIQRTPAPKSLQ